MEIKEANRAFFRNPAIIERYSTYRLHPQERVLFDRYCEPDSLVADIACGSGRTTLRLHEMGVAAIGMDASEVLISLAARRFPRIPFVIASYAGIPFKDRHFDHTIMALNSIDYAGSEEERVAVLAECRRILRPGGTLIFSSHNIKAFHVSPYYMSNANDLLLKLCNTFTAFRRAAYVRPRKEAVALYSSPEYVIRQTEAVGFRLIELLGFHNLKSRLANRYVSPWIYYIFRKEP